jgi:hypothetical protein
LFRHCVRRAASRACWIAGKRSEISTPMIDIEANSSISVNPGRLRTALDARRMAQPVIIAFRPSRNDIWFLRIRATRV